MNWETRYCPNAHCRCYGKPFGLGLLVNNGTRYGQPQALCKACGRSIALRTATASDGLDADPAIVETAVRALAEGHSLRATGRMVPIDQDTVCAWLDRAARHCRLVMLYWWSHLPVSEGQLDELWSLVPTQQDNLPGAKRYGETYGDAWVGIALAPVWRLGVAFVMGKRPQESANLWLARVAQVTDQPIPFFTSDQLPEYKNSLLHP